MATANAKQELSNVENIRNKAQQGQDAGIGQQAEVAKQMNVLLADVFALYMKTKNFHWHMTGPNFRDYHLLLEEQASALFGMTDDIAERVRKIGKPTLRSLEQVISQKRLASSEAEDLTPEQMLAELYADNQALAAYMRTTHTLTDEANDVASTSLLEEWIDQTEERAWFLGQIIGR